MRSCPSIIMGLLQRSISSDGDISEFFDLLGVGVVLQGDTLAPYLFVIVIDWNPHNAFPNPSLGFCTRPREDTPRSRCNSPHLYVTDLDFFAVDFAVLLVLFRRKHAKYDGPVD